MYNELERQLDARDCFQGLASHVGATKQRREQNLPHGSVQLDEENISGQLFVNSRKHGYCVRVHSRASSNTTNDDETTTDDWNFSEIACAATIEAKWEKEAARSHCHLPDFVDPPYNLTFSSKQTWALFFHLTTSCGEIGTDFTRNHSDFPTLKTGFRIT